MESLDITIENLGNLKRKITVTVPQDKVKEAYDKCYLSLKDKVNINGFRKGKLPQSFLEKRFKKVMKNEALETLVPEYYEKAIKQEDLKPAVQPSFDDLEIDKKEPLVFSAAFEVLPEIEAPDYSVYSLEKKEVVYTDEEVAEQRQRHLDNAATFEPKDGTADEGDQVVMDFEGKVDDESIAESQDQTYTLGSKQFLPEFETALEGMGKDEEKNFELTFPTDYNEEKLQNKTAGFWVKVKEIKQKQETELNEEFFNRYGEQVKSKEEFETFVENEVKFRKEQEIGNENRTQVKEKLAEILDFDVPEQILEEELGVRLNQAKQTKANEDVPQEELEENAKKDAVKDLRFSLFVQKMLEAEEIKTDEQQVYQRFQMNCMMMGIRPEELMQQEYGRQIYQQTYGMVTEESVLDFIINKALEQ
ncbi:MAG: trigger factor [Proteobacteria bacterium]|nr:trigger factor [Pseudomonadota bacterium]